MQEVQSSPVSCKNSLSFLIHIDDTGPLSPTFPITTSFLCHPCCRVHETRGLDLQAGWVPRATVVGVTTGSEIWVALASGLRTLQQLPPQVVTSASTPPRLPLIWLRPISDRLNSESSAIVVRDPSLSLLFDSRLSNYIPDVETRCHYHCLVGPGKKNVFWTTNKVSPTTFPFPPELAEWESVEVLCGAAAPSAIDETFIYIFFMLSL